MVKKKGPDIIDKVLEACYGANKDSLFVMSLMHQYEERGWLTKKQMQGLHNMASKVDGLSTGLLATLEATILKLPNRYKSSIEIKAPEKIKDEKIGNQIQAILAKYPQHKTVLSFQFKYEKNETFTSAETVALEKFFKLLV